MDQQTSGARVHLPADRAFLLQFAAQLTAEDCFHGRAEHLASGEVVHFTSLGHFEEFVARLVGAGVATQ